MWNGSVVIPTNIHMASGLAQYIPQPRERHSIVHEPMTLAAACRSMTEGAYPYYPARRYAECGCGRCSR